MFELDQARRNRERIKQGIGREFYDQQSRCVAQWESGELPPKGLILGELPYVNRKQIRLDRDDDLVVRWWYETPK